MARTYAVVVAKSVDSSPMAMLRPNPEAVTVAFVALTEEGARKWLDRKEAEDRQRCADYAEKLREKKLRNGETPDGEEDNLKPNICRINSLTLHSLNVTYLVSIVDGE